MTTPGGSAAGIGESELLEIYSFALRLAKDAGHLLMKPIHRRLAGGRHGDGDPEIRLKDSSVDIVTETDTKTYGILIADKEAWYQANVGRSNTGIEDFIFNSIRAKFPAHKFVGEETYSKASDKHYIVDDAPTWIVDPLDGTVNFAHLFPMVCISIGFAVGGHPVVGVINAPMLNQVVSAYRGGGAWLNDTQPLPLACDPIPPLPPNAPGGCILSCEWGKDRRDRPESNLYNKAETFLNMTAEPGGRNGKGGMVHGVRSLGSAAMGLAYAAMGSVDIWLEGGCWEWDVAGGIAILEEAGGLVTTANPPGDPTTCDIPKVHLGGRLYLGIRPAGPSETETAREAQERVVREVWKRVQPLDYYRP